MEELSNKEKEWLKELVRLGFCYTIEGSVLDCGMQNLVKSGLARKQWLRRVYFPTGKGIKFVEEK